MEGGRGKEMQNLNPEVLGSFRDFLIPPASSHKAV
jgi:hypothetical protein